LVLERTILSSTNLSKMKFISTGDLTMNPSNNKSGSKINKYSTLTNLCVVVAVAFVILLPHYSAKADNPPPGAVGYPVNTPTPSDLPRSKSLNTASLALATSTLNKFSAWNLKGGYVAAGVGMRNRGYGTINITVPSGSSVKAAYLYWDILGNAQDASFTQGQFNGTSIVGTFIGQSADACWGNSANFAYRADVTPWVAGSGSYALSGFRSGTATGSDPWVSGSTAPMLEGASLVVIYENPDFLSTQVMLYDGSFETSGATGTLTIDGFTTDANSAGSAQTTFIGADGQSEASDISTFNGSQLPITWAGADPQAGTRFQHGNLWDTLTVDVSNLITPGSTSATAGVQGAGDCLVWVAQAFSIQEVQLIADSFGSPVHTPACHPGCVGWYIQQGFLGTNKIYSGYHLGVDLKKTDDKQPRGSTTAGEKVYAMANGYIAYADSNAGYPPPSKGFPGGVVIIKHILPDFKVVYTLYGHLDPETFDQFNLQVGARITKDTPIGIIMEWPWCLSGTPENVYGPDGKTRVNVKCSDNSQATGPQNSHVHIQMITSFNPDDIHPPEAYNKTEATSMNGADLICQYEYESILLPLDNPMPPNLKGSKYSHACDPKW
jgi:hypothetical protein